MLTTAQRARFAELAIFPEDAEIPLPTLEKLWERTSGTDEFDDFDTEDLCSRLNRLSLLWSYDAEQRRIRLHDVVRAFLITQHHAELTAFHNHLLEAHIPATPSPTRPGTANWAALPATEPYLWENLAFHLVEAGRGAELVATVKDWRYLATKAWLRKAAAVEADLVAAVGVAADDDPLRVLLRNYVNTGHLLNHCEDQRGVEASLYSRLQHLAELKALLLEMRAQLQAPCLEPLTALPDQPHPALIRTLEGHAGMVNGCAVSADGKLVVSGSSDQTVRVWDGVGGRALAVFYADGPLYGCALHEETGLVVALGVRGGYFLRLVR